MSRVRARIAVPAAVIALCFGLAAPASADTPFDLDFTGDGTGTIGNFGYPNTATYGQTVTVPDGVDGIATFSFVMDLPAAVVFRGVVQAWDGEKATGPVLYLSEPRSTAGAGSEVVTFAPDILVEPGQYVIYATISHDYATNALIVGTSSGNWAMIGEDPYDAGDIVFMNDSGNVDLLTTNAWVNWGADMAFGLTFFVAAAPADPVVADPDFTG